MQLFSASSIKTFDYPGAAFGACPPLLAAIRQLSVSYVHNHGKRAGITERIVNQITSIRIASCKVLNDPYRLVKIDAKCTDGVDDAADLAHAFAGGGLTDWYLPARDELQEMYDVIGPGADNAGNFKDDIGNAYWTSSEDSLDDALQVVFTNGNSNAVAKNFNRFVRAVRIFDNTP